MQIVQSVLFLPCKSLSLLKMPNLDAEHGIMVFHELELKVTSLQICLSIYANVLPALSMVHERQLLKCLTS